MRRILVVLAASLLVLVGSTGPAAAHAKLESMTPADGTTMAVPPTKVVLTFNEPVGSTGAKVEVKSPTGVNVASGELEVLDNTVTQPVGAMIETGRYQVAVRIVSADGHPITATGSFTVTHAGHDPNQPAVPPTTPAERGSNVATIVAMSLIMLVVVALAVVIVRRRPAA
ncbi:copper resistance protein CopC [Kribbella flavida DSM 17836]|uniref:Copper resistance protein CopC n=1 Tax=Kribbella flavida (strain DSM 17836 / JCM 10339 / NBRC 14399) TaxID=479435 RepID=D2PQ53_KRIFD|nr:copper resistance CopC family protein [Kribbella flavida]ADB34755.1 copper resistance protein CopC [Kribbella flavida DSM 17836]